MTMSRCVDDEDPEVDDLLSSRQRLRDRNGRCMDECSRKWLQCTNMIQLSAHVLGVMIRLR